MIGKLYTDDGNVYVLLKTALGFIALDVVTLQCFGVPRGNIEDAIDGLQPTGLKLDLSKSRMIDNDLDY